MSGKRRRQVSQNDEEIVENGFVTVCEARFLPLEVGGTTAVLVWACPSGVPAPSSSEELEEICHALFGSGSVKSCATPSGLVLEAGQEEELPSTS